MNYDLCWSNVPLCLKRVEFDDVHRLGDGQSKHSPEAFYAGSLWKVSVQAFNDEDPRGRRTLGILPSIIYLLNCCESCDRHWMSSTSLPMVYRVCLGLLTRHK
jgi:hypothetical protein